MFKIKNGMAPEIVYDTFLPSFENHYSNLRQQNDFIRPSMPNTKVQKNETTFLQN